MLQPMWKNLVKSEVKFVVGLLAKLHNVMHCPFDVDGHSSHAQSSRGFHFECVAELLSHIAHSQVGSWPNRQVAKEL